MRIASITLVKDEADILEGFIRHNLHFVDRMYVVDDRSTDNTAEILRRLTEETTAVRLLQDGWTGAFQQARRTTAAMKRVLADEAWDVILALDADELICAADRATFESDISAIPPGHAGGFSALQYFAIASDDASIPDPLLRVRTALTSPSLFKSFVVAPINPDISFGEGNHFLHLGETQQPAHVLPRAPLAHFAIRSADQIAIKCLKHYVGWRSRSDYKESLSSHLIAGARALKQEASFALRPSSSIFDVYLGFDPAKGQDRPFIERRGEIKWPELAVTTPYAQLLGLLDQVIARGKSADEIQNEVERFQSSPSRLFKAYLKAVALRLKRSISKRLGG
jgi:glycosyltransferase involved in cell wall biosynthesis